MRDTVNDGENGLIELARSGDRSAFGKLVRKYQSRVINVVYRMCGDPELAEDAAQVTFLKAWQRLPQFKTGTAFHSWLYRIAVNAAVDILRKEKPQVVLEDLPVRTPGENMESVMIHKERQRLVQQAVLNLPDASRAVLVLKEYEGLSYREIANTLDIPMGTVMSRLNYARNRLAQSLRNVMEEV